jgi:hypothetical protein
MFAVKSTPYIVSMLLIDCVLNIYSVFITCIICNGRITTISMIKLLNIAQDSKLITFAIKYIIQRNEYQSKTTPNILIKINKIIK